MILLNDAIENQARGKGRKRKTQRDEFSQQYFFFFSLLVITPQIRNDIPDVGKPFKP